MLKKLRTILLWLALFAYLIIVFTFVTRKVNDLSCEDIEVTVVDSVYNRFVGEKDILKMIARHYSSVKGSSMDSVDKEKLEAIIKQAPSVKNAEVYSTLTGRLRVEVKQRNPLLRILQGESGYYIDEEGKVMPLSGRYTSRVLVASGAISKEMAQGELFELARFIRDDEFWRSQIDQIHVTRNNEFILVPRVGAQKIEMGTMENYRGKFRKLFALYKDGFSQVGWNKYKKIDLKYENQVVCTKR